MLVRFVEINSQFRNYFDFPFDTNGPKRCINPVYGIYLLVETRSFFLVVARLTFNLTLSSY